MSQFEAYTKMATEGNEMIDSSTSTESIGD